MGIAILYLSTGMSWLSVSGGGTSSQSSPLDLSSVAQTHWGLSGGTPTNDSLSGMVYQIFLSAFATSGFLLMGGLLFPVVMVLSIISLFRWKLMALAGLLGVLSVSSWTVGLWLVGPSAVAQLNEWYGSTTSWSFGPGFGTFVTLIGGLVLVLGYALSRMDKLEWPID